MKEPIVGVRERIMHQEGRPGPKGNGSLRSPVRWQCSYLDL